MVMDDDDDDDDDDFQHSIHHVLAVSSDGGEILSQMAQINSLNICDCTALIP